MFEHPCRRGVNATSIRQLEAELVAHTRGKGIASTSRPRQIKGANAALTIEYTKDGLYSFDLVATARLDPKLRAVKCHVPWFEHADTRRAREDTCTRTIETLL